MQGHVLMTSTFTVTQNWYKISGSPAIIVCQKCAGTEDAIFSVEFISIY